MYGLAAGLFFPVDVMQDVEYETARATATSNRACAAVGATCPRGALARGA